jgi:hypothetical protein
MKKILYTIFVSFIAFFAMPTFTAQAQGNLQFNRVISVSLALNPNQSITLITVPTGKVWKIEAIEAVTSGQTNYLYEINGQVFPISNSYSSKINNSLWLKAGDTFRVMNNPTGGSSVPFYYSILEFNIVP